MKNKVVRYTLDEICLNLKQSNPLPFSCQDSYNGAEIDLYTQEVFQPRLDL